MYATIFHNIFFFTIIRRNLQPMMNNTRGRSSYTLENGEIPGKIIKPNFSLSKRQIRSALHSHSSPSFHKSPLRCHNITSLSSLSLSLSATPTHSFIFFSLFFFFNFSPNYGSIALDQEVYCRFRVSFSLFPFVVFCFEFLLN